MTLYTLLLLVGCFTMTCHGLLPPALETSEDSCYFTIDDINDKHVAYLARRTSKEMIVNFPTEALFSCELTIVAIGGGGSPGAGPGIFDDHGGGGSGYIESATISSISDTPFVVHVGNGTEESRVDTAAGETIVRAHPGKYGGSGFFKGGDGYSGGGAGANCYHWGSAGGSNGGDGQDSSYGHGGKGSGLDISTIALEHFKLTPGEGGGACPCNGGGGGGVLVDGQGPPDWGSYVPNFYNEAQGYGAGGGGSTPFPAKQGIVIIEMKKKQ